jgi:hypothetical protein
MVCLCGLCEHLCSSTVTEHTVSSCSLKFSAAGVKSCTRDQLLLNTLSAARRSWSASFCVRHTHIRTGQLLIEQLRTGKVHLRRLFNDGHGRAVQVNVQLVAVACAQLLTHAQHPHVFAIADEHTVHTHPVLAHISDPRTCPCTVPRIPYNRHNRRCSPTPYCRR